MTARRASGTANQLRKTLPPAVLRDIVRRVVAAARPEKIILFGSAARGTMGLNSDVDLLIIKRGKFNRARVENAIYRELRGAGAAVDAIVVTPEGVERYGAAPWPCDPSRVARGEGCVWRVSGSLRPIRATVPSEFANHGRVVAAGRIQFANSISSAGTLATICLPTKP